MYTVDDVIAASLQYFNGDELAANTFLKYALKNKDNQFLEDEPDKMHWRLAKEFARIEAQFNKSNGLNEAEIFQWLEKFKYIVPQGSPMSGIGNPYANISLSNCVVVPGPEDNVSSIMDQSKALANLFKRRCGVGTDLSHLRPDGTAVSNAAGTTSGAWSFADLYSYVCRMIGQNGRRGALMLTMDVRHPDIFKFVTMKHDKTKVTGANISVKLSDVFMQAVVNDEDFALQWPVDVPLSDAKIVHKIRARELWDVIVDSATTTAEPGLLMWDNIVSMLPAHSYPLFKTICTNPCAELPLSAYDSCRLISLNLKNIVKNPFQSNAEIDMDLFRNMVNVGQRLSDDLVELELEKIDNLINICDQPDEKDIWLHMRETCSQGRRTGLGTHGLADMLARLCLPYGSNEALDIIDTVYCTIKYQAYKTSIELAKERGTFPAFNWNTERENKYINLLPEDLKAEMAIHGRRNISLLTNAPTGSVSIMSQTSSGIEPVFRNSYTRRKKKNQGDIIMPNDILDDNGDRWEEFEVLHHNIKEFIVEQKQQSNAELPKFFTTSDQIDWQKRIDVQATIQQHIDHSISSTINLPKGISRNIVGAIYSRAWEKGLKGVTVYVDGSRDGVLISDDKEGDNNVFMPKDAVARPDELEVEIHSVHIKGEKWTIIIGLLNGFPYEVFGGLADQIELPQKYKTGKVVKRPYKTKPSEYDLELEDGFKLKNIVKLFNNELYQVHTRMISLALRLGAEPVLLVEQLQKDPDNDLRSFSKVVARVLKKYVTDGTKSNADKICSSCGQEGLVYQDGCPTCLHCGWTRCS